MAIALDTNILVYGAGLHVDRRTGEAARIIAALPAGKVVVPVQVLAEFFRVLVTKAKWPPAAATEEVHRLMAAFVLAGTTAGTFASALALANRQAFQIFDAAILAAAAEAGCSLLLSEDLQHGFAWRGVTVVNPFAPEPHPLLVRALQSH